MDCVAPAGCCGCDCFLVSVEFSILTFPEINDRAYRDERHLAF